MHAVSQASTRSVQACAALGIGGAEHDMTPSSNSALKSITLGEHVMHFAADSKAGIMACVSFMQPLQATVAANFTQASLCCLRNAAHFAWHLQKALSVNPDPCPLGTIPCPLKAGIPLP